MRRKMPDTLDFEIFCIEQNVRGLQDFERAQRLKEIRYAQRDLAAARTSLVSILVKKVEANTSKTSPELQM